MLYTLRKHKVRPRLYRLAGGRKEAAVKVLIWVGCFALFALVEVGAILLGHELGSVPTILLSAACFLLARALTARYDERQKQKRIEERRKKK